MRPVVKNSLAEMRITVIVPRSLIYASSEQGGLEFLNSYDIQGKSSIGLLRL